MTGTSDSIAAAVAATAARYRGNPHYILQMLREIQEACDWISPEAIDRLQAELRLPRTKIEGVAGFYAFLYCSPRGRYRVALRMKIEDWDAILNTNLSSVFRLSKAVLRGMMKPRSGRIISIASVVGLTGNAGQANYAAAKAGIIGFSKSLAREVASRNITSNVVAPGFIDTDMTRALSEEQRTALAGSIPLARLGSPEDIAAAVLYLASPAGAYVTGETLSVNGGMYMP